MPALKTFVASMDSITKFVLTVKTLNALQQINTVIDFRLAILLV